VCVQTGSEAHPASCTVGTGSPFPGAKRGRVVTLTTHPHLVPRSRMNTSYTSSPPNRDCFGEYLISDLYLTTTFFQIRKPTYSLVVIISSYLHTNNSIGTASLKHQTANLYNACCSSTSYFWTVTKGFEFKIGASTMLLTTQKNSLIHTYFYTLRQSHISRKRRVSKSFEPVENNSSFSEKKTFVMDLGCVSYQV